MDSVAQAYVRRLLYSELEDLIEGIELLRGPPVEDDNEEAAELQNHAISAALDIVIKTRGVHKVEFHEDELEKWLFALDILVGFERMQRDLEIRDYVCTGLEGHHTFEVKEANDG